MNKRTFVLLAPLGGHFIVFHPADSSVNQSAPIHIESGGCGWEHFNSQNSPVEKKLQKNLRSS
jgi:hypothetical protein